MATTEHDDEENHDSPRKGKRLILVILVVLALLGAAGGGLYFAGMLPIPGAAEQAGDDAPAEEESAHGEAGKDGEAGAKAAGPIFYDLPEFLINLNTGGRGTSFLKMKIALELPSEEMVQKVQAIEPRITDSINTYLRELRASDLSGSAGLYRLREELLMRINKSLQPQQVNDVLFKEIIVQ